MMQHQTNFDLLARARFRRATPCISMARAVRDVAPEIVESADSDRKRAAVIDTFIATLDAEIRAIERRDLADIARRAGL